MFKNILIIFTIFAVLLIGCNNPQKSPSLGIEGLKIRDLAPYHSDPNVQEKPFTAGIEIIVFEVPVKNLKFLKDVSTLLSTNQLQFNNEKAFKNNAFSAALGQSTMWDKVAELLQTARASQGDKNSLLLTSDHQEYLPVQILNEQKTIYYASQNNPAEQITIGPGKLLINMDAKNIPGSKGVTQFNITPMFTKGVTSPIPQLAEKLKEHDLHFTSAGFTVQMGPDDFIFIWPAKGVAQKSSLANAFFIPSDNQQVFKTYLIICTGLNY